MAKAQKIKQKKTVKKRFFPVDSKLTSTKIELYASEPEDLIGKVVKIDLTKPLRGKAFELKLKVISHLDKLSTEPISMQLFQPYIKKIIRKGTDYSEDSFESSAKDYILRIKPLLVTRNRVSRSVLNALRENARKQINSYVKIRTTQEIFTDITTNKFQKELSQKLKKIYPLALCEIRSIKTIKPVEKTKEEKNQ